MASVTPQPRPVTARPFGKTQATSVRMERGPWARPAVIAVILLAAFFLLQSQIPLRTAVQIGADEGFELAKATLCLHGHKLYSEVWNDQPPLHTFLVTQIIKHVTPSILWATVGDDRVRSRIAHLSFHHRLAHQRAADRHVGNRAIDSIAWVSGIELFLYAGDTGAGDRARWNRRPLGFSANQMARGGVFRGHFIWRGGTHEIGAIVFASNRGVDSPASTT